MVEIPKCSSYEEQFIQDYGNSINTGEILYRKECRCLGTKEQEICSCGGDEEKCDFFPEKRGPKPCPFCGKLGAIYELHRDTHPTEIFFPSCTDIHCLGRNLGKGYSSKLKALEDWNRREGERK